MSNLSSSAAPPPDLGPRSTSDAAVPGPAPWYRHRALRLVPTLIGGTLLWWFLRSVDLHGLTAGLARIPRLAILAIVVAAALSTTLQGVRFWLLFPGGAGPLKHIGLSFLVSAGNILLPLRSGEALRPFYLKRGNPSLSVRELVRWTVVDKILEIASTLPILLAACVLLPSRFGALLRWARPVTVVMVALTAVILLFQLRATFSAVATGGRQRLTAGRLLLATLASLGYWGVNYLIFFAVIPDIAVALGLLLGVSLSGMIPGLPAGMGTYEAAFLWIGQQASIASERLLPAAIASHGLQLLVTLVCGVPALLRVGVRRQLAATETDS